MKKILILANKDVGLYNFRKELLEALLLDNNEVYISLPYGEKIDKLTEMGCRYIETQFNRRSKNPLEEIKLFLNYVRLLKAIKPDISLLYTAKPNIYGGLACRILGYKYISNITGLGSVIHQNGFLSKCLIFLYRLALKKAGCIFFQNSQNENLFLKNNIGLNISHLIPGSGVNLADFSLCPYPEGKQISFLFVGRLLKDKGIEELVEAARIIKSKYDDINFDVIGSAEEHYREQFAELNKKGVVNFLGYKSNVKDYIRKCNAIVHPSYHEGMSNVLLEAASTGRPIIASMIPGCSETFDESVSGYGFQAQNIDDLVSVLEKFINLKPEDKKNMGLSGRKKMEIEFDRNIIINSYFEKIEQITDKKINS